MRRLVLVVVVVACTTPNNTDSLVVTRPAGAGCATAGIEIDTGLDTNHDAILEPDEITSTSLVCEPAPPPAQQLVRVVPEPSGAHCPNGGQAIETGADANGNGVLDPAEVSAASYVCSDGAATLVRVDPAGAGCAHGGSAIHTGLDANDNGVLDDAEIASTSYVCDGANGQVILVRVDPEPAGDDCADGGTAIHVGVDANADGSLEDDEIQSTSYLCGAPPLPTVIDGDFTVENDLDLAQLAGVTQITGSLVIEDDALTALILPNLIRVDGTLRCGINAGASCSRLLVVDLPMLATASDQTINTANPGIVFWAAELTTFHLPALVTAPWIKLSLVGSLDLPAFTSGRITISNGQLTAVTLPLMAHGDVQIDTDTTLTTLDLPALLDGAVAIEDVPTLTTISAPLLVEGSFEANNTPSLTAVSFPLLASGSYVDLEHTGLSSLPFPSLTALTYLTISNNPSVPTCSAQALATQAHATTVTISGNDDTGICP